MSSEFAAEFEADALPELLDVFGQSVVRRIQGDAGNTATVTALWKEELPNRQTANGEEIERKGRLVFDPDQTVQIKDTWVIFSEVWQTERITGKDDGGKLSVWVTRRDKQTQGGGGGTIL